MATKLYVGNLNYRTTDDALRELFEQYGEVASATVVTDRTTGRSKGFGFVEMMDAEAAKNAQSELDGNEFEGRALKVDEARPRAESGGGGGYR